MPGYLAFSRITSLGLRRSAEAFQPGCAPDCSVLRIRLSRSRQDAPVPNMRAMDQFWTATGNLGFESPIGGEVVKTLQKFLHANRIRFDSAFCQRGSVSHGCPWTPKIQRCHIHVSSGPLATPARRSRLCPLPCSHFRYFQRRLGWLALRSRPGRPLLWYPVLPCYR